MKLPIEGMKLTPEGWPYMSDPFCSCLSWAAGNPEIIAAFEKETGEKIDCFASRGIAGMIDEATGRRLAVAAIFADWVVENVWGEES